MFWGAAIGGGLQWLIKYPLRILYLLISWQISMPLSRQFLFFSYKITRFSEFCDRLCKQFQRKCWNHIKKVTFWKNIHLILNTYKLFAQNINSIEIEFYTWKSSEKLVILDTFCEKVIFLLRQYCTNTQIKIQFRKPLNSVDSPKVTDF